MKKVESALNMCVYLEEIITTTILVEENEVLSKNKDETLQHEERLTLLTKNHDALTTALDPHKEKIKEIGKLIA